jgi:hypothetical protein
VWPTPAPKQSRAPVIISLVVALIAIAVAIGGWFRPASEASAPDTKSQFSEQQVADAKTAMCAAFDKATKAVAGAGSQTSDDPATKVLISVNTRLAFHVMTDYFRSELAQNPAAPPELVNAFRNSISAYEDMVLTQLANAPKDELDAVYAKTTASDEAMVEACK